MRLSTNETLKSKGDSIEDLIGAIDSVSGNANYGSNKGRVINYSTNTSHDMKSASVLCAAVEWANIRGACIKALLVEPKVVDTLVAEYCAATNAIIDSGTVNVVTLPLHEGVVLVIKEGENEP